MLVTNLAAIKSLSYVVYNTLSLLTVLPLAIAVLAGFWVISCVYENMFLVLTGTISYEIYLIHMYFLYIIGASVKQILFFIGFTYISAVVLHFLTGKNLKINNFVYSVKNNTRKEKK